MADDHLQDQTQTTQETPIIPPIDQPPVEMPPTQTVTEQPQTTPTETPNIPNPPNSPNPEPVAPATPESQTQSTETKTETLTPTETAPPVSPPVLDIPALHYPFSGNFPATFSFGQQSDNEEIKKKFQEWGIVGHNGLDFGLSTGNEVFACDVGKVIQSGDNDDFGTSITIQHSWGQSIYGHLQETKVKEGDEIQVNKVIGLSGSSGAAFGEHLHFAIKPNNPDLNNGYFGFIDPAPYLSLPSQKEEIKQETPKPEETKPPEPVIQQPEPTINIEPEKLAEQSEPPQIPQNSQTPQVNDEEIQKQVDERLKIELDNRRQKANEARSQKKEDHLNKIFEFVRDKKVVTNEDIRDFLHVSQSTATNYLAEMANRGMLKKEGNRGGAKYSI